MNRRTPKRDYRPPISAEALAVWRQCRELERQGRHAELSLAGKRLCVLLGHSWLSMQWPTTVSSKPPAHLTMPERRDLLEEWYAARHWRDALEAADHEAGPAE
jgi:hypothetical protein